MTSLCTPHQFLLRTFFHSNQSPLSFHFIHFLLVALLTPTIILTRLFVFSQIWTFSRCFTVSAIVYSAFMYTGVAHELSTFPLRLRDMRLSPITHHPFEFPPTFAPAVILIVIKAINLVDLQWENATSYREFVNFKTQRYMRNY